MIEVRRLAWAGLEVSAAGHSIVVDLVEDFSRLHGGAPPAAELPAPPAPGSVAAGLVTHLHSDHADAAALGRALRAGAPVLRPELATGAGAEVALVERAEAAFAASELEQCLVAPWQTVGVGPFEITALPAADGFGDPQVSWSIAAEGCRVLHAGDAVFHGWWWLAALRCGPSDAVFLPAGGAVVDLPARQPASPLPAGMDPRQAAVAAKLLQARLVVPIHYGPLHEAPNYVQVGDPPGALLEAAGELGVEALILQPGERLQLEAR